MWLPGALCPGRRIRAILHNINLYDPRSRLVTLWGTFGLPLFSGPEPRRWLIVLKVTKQIPLTGGPNNIAITPDGEKLYVARVRPAA